MSTKVRRTLFGAFAALAFSSAVSAQNSQAIQHAPAHFDISPPLSELARNAPKPSGPPKVMPEPGPTPWFGGEPTGLPDPLVRRNGGNAPSPLLSATLGANFDGISQGSSGFTVNSAPPDTTGDIGPNHYVQWVNSSYAIFSRTGTVLIPPTAGNSLWTGFGGICETNNSGDPLVKYDRLADRWVLTQFAVPSGGPFAQCFAISTTADPTGTYFRYQFSQPNFNDYPHMGVWPDGYYVTYNMFNAAGTSFLGSRACAYDRTKMLAGVNSAGMEQCIQLSNSYGSLLPSDWNGATAPSAGAPNYHYNFSTLSALNYWKFHVDWTTPANTTFGTGTNAPDGSVAVTAFTRACNGGTCIPQPGTTQQLDSLAGRLMYRVGYRKFPTYEAWVISHSVDTAGTGTGVTGIRWYELRNAGATGAVPSKFQEGTFSPDDSYRWMPSIGMDKAGDIAIGYSVSAGTAAVKPSVGASGRLPDDTAGAMQAETTLQPGGGVQTGGLSRWGDYSTMQLDPTDDCTFWFTTEYLKNSGSFNWSTRIASFKMTPSAPSGVTINAATAGQLTVGWTAVSNAASYTVTRYTSGSCGAGAVTTFTVAAGLNSYTDTSVTGGVTYSYNVTVTTACATSAASSCVTGTVVAACTAPSPAAGLTANVATANQAFIQWTANGNPSTTKYSVYRGAAGANCSTGTFITLTTGITGAGPFAYTDTAVTAGSYVYRVVAFDSTGGCPSAPVCLNATVTGGPLLYSRGKFSSGKPVNTSNTTSGAVRWVYQTSAATMSYPGLNIGVWATSNDRVVHAMGGTATGGDAGTWPGNVSGTIPKWRPFVLDAPSQNRPIIPTLTLPGGSTKQVYLSGQDGFVYCVDANTGALIWKSAKLGDVVQAAPSAMLQKYGNSYNAIFIGVRNSAGDGKLYALSPFDGSTLGSFSGDATGTMGVVLSYVAIDYTKNTIYFTTRRNTQVGGSSQTVWALNVLDSGGLLPAAGVASTFGNFAKRWAVAVKDTDAAPGLVKGRLYVGNDIGEINAFDTNTGASIWTAPFATSDGPVKYNVIYDWTSSAASQRVFFSTTSTVWCVTDTWDGLASLPVAPPVAATWSSVVSSPSPINFNGSYLLIGAGDGNLYKFTSPATSNAKTALTLDPSVILAVGGASIDNQAVGGPLSYVGTDAGSIYCVVP